MKVTEVGRKWGGTRGPDTAVGRDDADGSGVLLPWPPAGVAEEECLAATPEAGAGLTCRFTTCGTVTAAATITAAAPAVSASLPSLRRRARRLISSKVPGGGGRGSIRSLSQ